MSTKSERANRLLPCGVPRYVRCYDNGGTTWDRYTVVYTGRYPKIDHEFHYVGMSEHPFAPNGFGQHGESHYAACDTNEWGFAPAIGRSNNLGKRIAFADLPDDCKSLVLSDYRELWGL